LRERKSSRACTARRQEIVKPAEQAADRGVNRQETGMEVAMTEAKSQGPGAAAQTEKTAEAEGDTSRRQSVGEAARHVGEAARHVGEAARQQTERLADQAREGVRQAGAASAAGADAVLHSGSAIAQGVQDITTAWTRYAEDVMRQTSEASRALMSCHSFPEMLEVQARLLRGNLQAFLDQSTRIADIAGRMAARPFEAMGRAAADQPRR
jgi:hypothetical protein